METLSLDAGEGCRLMNQLAACGEAFFFYIDAWASRWLILDYSRARSEGIRWDLDGKGNLPPPTPIGRDFYFNYKAVSPEDYARGFRIIRQAQQRGETWLANLTYPAELETDLGLCEIIMSADSSFRLLIPRTLGVFSPERFVRISASGRISSCPMKGTIDAAVPDAETKILSDSKEMAEHITIIDLIRNDLSMVAGKVHVPRFRFLSRVTASNRQLLQVSSEIVGELGDSWKTRLGDIFRSILPAGSVTGAPKLQTGEIIREAEGYDRGWYTGVFGSFDGIELDSAVAIRYVERSQSDTLIYKSGGGITINSVMEDEYQELKDKIYVPFT